MLTEILRHLPHAGLDATRASTGVVWCTERAAEYGFLDKPDEWANLGQGAPEVTRRLNFQRGPERSDSLAGRRRHRRILSAAQDPEHLGE